MIRMNIEGVCLYGWAALLGDSIGSVIIGKLGVVVSILHNNGSVRLNLDQS